MAKATGKATHSKQTSWAKGLSLNTDNSARTPRTGQLTREPEWRTVRGQGGGETDCMGKTEDYSGVVKYKAQRDTLLAHYSTA